jgi:hypothetical protein
VQSLSFEIPCPLPRLTTRTRQQDSAAWAHSDREADDRRQHTGETNDWRVI